MSKKVTVMMKLNINMISHKIHNSGKWLCRTQRRHTNVQ